MGNYKGWLNGYTKKRPTPPVEINDSEIKLVVNFKPLKCPNCNSRRVHCYGASARPILYYECQDCGTKFKVFEVDND